MSWRRPRGGSIQIAVLFRGMLGCICNDALENLQERVIGCVDTRAMDYAISDTKVFSTRREGNETSSYSIIAAEPGVYNC